MDILLVDDEEIIHRTLGNVLSRSGHHVRGALNGVEALQEVDKSVPDLILSDIRMPVMDGLELIEKLRVRAPTTPRVLITGYGDEDVLIAALQHGAYDYLRKPIQLDKLLDLIDRVRTRKELEQSVLQQAVRSATSEPTHALTYFLAGAARVINTPAAVLGNNLNRLHELFAELSSLPEESLPEESADRGLDSRWLRDRLETALRLTQEARCATERIGHVARQLQVCASMPASTQARDIDLRELVEQVIARFVAAGETTPVELRGGRVKVNGFESELNQALVNLVRNATQAVAGRNDGRVTITVDTPESGWGSIAVADNGDGIPDHVADSVFQPFFTTRTAGEGLGLGLTVCQRVVQVHGGHISFSAPPGEGCCFWMHLPCHRHEPITLEGQAGRPDGCPPNTPPGKPYDDGGHTVGMSADPVTHRPAR